MLTISDDPKIKNQLYPFAQIRPVVEIRIGILTIKEKWQKLLGPSVHLQPALADEPALNSFPCNLIPSKSFAVDYLKEIISPANYQGHSSYRLLEFPWHIAEYNDWALREDFKLITEGRYSQPIPETVQAIKSTQIFIEEGARMQYCILNATTGPIYIGKHAEIMEGAIIRGPFALCEGSVVKMGTKIYGATTVGPHSVVGGEIKNSVIFGYSNKAHDGYLGDSVIGEWCNIGAGTSNSNLKNTASDVKLWHQPAKEFLNAGLKCGVMMGDYSRCAINTSFNTATVTGIAAHVFGEGLTSKYIPDFSWGSDGKERYRFEKALQDISNWKKLKNKILTDQDIQILKGIFDHT